MGKHSRNLPADKSRSGFRRILAAGSAMLMLGTAGAVVAPAAQADTGNVVTFGDSFSANPEQIHNSLRAVPGPLGEWANAHPQTAGCLQAPNNFPHKIGEKTNRPVADYSCTGNTSGGMLKRIDAALNDNAIHDDSTIVMSIGMNDFGGFGIIDNGANILDPVNVADHYRANIQEAARKIRERAPHAELVLAGALPTVDRVNTTFCAVNTVPNMPMGVPVPLLRDIENWNRENQKLAAGDIQGKYVEIIDGARGHDTCAPDQERYVAGLVDTTTPDYNMIFHPSNKGSEYAAETIANAI